MRKRLSELFKKSDGSTDNSNSMSNTLRKIKSGDIQLKEKFIVEYKPFIKKVVMTVTRKYMYIEDCDEFSIGLIAFNEAIDCYDESKNRKFISFAEMVIKRRLLNFIKVNSKKSKEYPFTYLENESNKFEENYLYSSDPHFEKIELVQEIRNLTTSLKDFKIDLNKIPEYVPKHRDSKELAINIARILSQNSELMKKLLRKKSIPVTDLLKHIDVHPKTVQRHNKYIIFTCLILHGEYDHLKSFIDSKGRRGN